MGIIKNIKNLIKPDFEEWSKNYLEIEAQIVLENMKKQGVKVKGNTFYTHTPNEKAFHLHVAYQNQMQTRSLVSATWILAISTIILVAISLFIK